MKHERQVFEAKLRESDDRISALDVENTEVMQRCEVLMSDKHKVERRMDLITEDLEVMSY